jgi:hypothetical protein
MLFTASNESDWSGVKFKSKSTCTPLAADGVAVAFDAPPDCNNLPVKGDDWHEVMLGNTVFAAEPRANSTTLLPVAFELSMSLLMVTREMRRVALVKLVRRQAASRRSDCAVV